MRGLVTFSVASALALGHRHSSEVEDEALTDFADVDFLSEAASPFDRQRAKLVFPQLTEENASIAYMMPELWFSMFEELSVEPLGKGSFGKVFSALSKMPDIKFPPEWPCRRKGDSSVHFDCGSPGVMEDASQIEIAMDEGRQIFGPLKRSQGWLALKANSMSATEGGKLSPAQLATFYAQESLTHAWVGLGQGGQQAGNPYVLPLYGWYPRFPTDSADKHYWMMTKLMSGGTVTQLAISFTDGAYLKHVSYECQRQGKWKGDVVSEDKSKAFAAVFVDVAFGLKKVWDKGVAHCDMKPDNVLVGQPDTCRANADLSIRDTRIADFGCACFHVGPGLLDGRLQKCSGYIAGTPAFLPHETFVKQESCGPPTDMWGLGMTMYFLWFEKLPFHPHQIGVWMSKWSGNMDLTGMPRHLELAVSLMLKKDPTERKDMWNAAVGHLENWYHETYGKAYQARPDENPGFPSFVADLEVCMRIGCQYQCDMEHIPIKCVCPTDKVLNDDGKTCSSPTGAAAALEQGAAAAQWVFHRIVEGVDAVRARRP